MNEKSMVELLLDMVLGEDLEVELVAGDSQLESQAIFDILQARKISNLIAWRQMPGRVNRSIELPRARRIRHSIVEL